MALNDNVRLNVGSGVVSSFMRMLRGIVGRTTNYSPEESLAEAKNIDPRMVPKVPMSAEKIDVNLLNELGKLGLKHGKLMTAESHPEVIASWQELCRRAGLQKVPQLILTESRITNAITATPEEVVLTTGLLKALTLRELNAVLAHELGHEMSEHHKPQLVATVVLGSTGVVLGNRLAHRGGIGGILQRSLEKPSWLKDLVTWKYGPEAKPLSVLGSLVTMAVGWDLGSIAAGQLTVPARELEADRKGALISGDPAALASVLRKLDMPKGHRSFLQWHESLKLAYPSIATRIEHLEALAAKMPAPIAHEDQPALQPAQKTQPSPQVTGIAADERLTGLEMPSVAIH